METKFKFKSGKVVSVFVTVNEGEPIRIDSDFDLSEDEAQELAESDDISQIIQTLSIHE